MGFFMDGLGAEAYDRIYQDRQLVRRILHYFRPRLRLMASIAALILLKALLDTLSPLLMARTLDSFIASRSLYVALLLAAFIMLAAMLSWLCNLFRQWFMARAVGDVVLQLRKDAFASVMQRDMSFFDQFVSGAVVSRVTSDTQSFSSVVTLILDLLSQVTVFLLIAVVLFARSWYLALLTLTVLPAIVLVTLGFRYLARRSTRLAQRSLARVNANVQEVISGITVAKNFRQERSMYEAFQRVNAQSYQINVRSSFLYSSVYPVLGALANIGTTIVIYFGGQSVLHHTLSAGDWFLFIQGIGILWHPLTSIASFWSQFQLGLAASERVFALLDAESRVQQIAAQPVSHVEGKIEFRNVVFRYDERQSVLTDFNLTIAAGETIAFVGHTGAGKTSLGRLIARFYEFQGGQLLIDGHDIRTFDLQAYRRHLGIVPQVPFLFSGTVADNIRYACPSATDDEVLAVARRIGGGDWLRSLPYGLETEVGEAGKVLSMGQRQLVSLARVLLQNPSIIILDEATASVDPLTEAQLQEGLDVLLKNRTAILIAHRLSTIRHADRIIVLQQGCIVEEGSHTSLLQAGGQYAHLYNAYFRHQSPDYQPGESIPSASTSENML